MSGAGPGAAGPRWARAENVRRWASRGGNAAGAVVVVASGWRAGAESFPPSQRRAERRLAAVGSAGGTVVAETTRFPCADAARGATRPGCEVGGPPRRPWERPPAARAARVLRVSSHVKEKSAVRVGRGGAEPGWRGAACSRRAGAAQHLAGCSCCQRYPRVTVFSIEVPVS